MVKSQDGTYHWTGKLDKGYEMGQYRFVWITMGILCAGMTIFGAVLCLPSGDWKMMMAFVLPVLTVIVITAVVIAVGKGGAWSYRAYGMSERSIWIGAGRSRADFYFDSARHVLFTAAYIDPMKKIGNFRIYVPEKDMPFVKNFVMAHLPPECVIDDQSYVL